MRIMQKKPMFVAFTMSFRAKSNTLATAGNPTKSRNFYEAIR